jgi:NitT/TauT family transport system permease protein
MSDLSMSSPSQTTEPQSSELDLDGAAAPSRWHLHERTGIYIARVLVLAIVLVAWQYVPDLLARFKLVAFNRLFISSPSLIVEDLYRITSSGLIWQALWSTISASLIGLVAGVAFGYAVALLFGEFKRVADVLMPYVDALNAIPRIALFPLIVIIVGFGSASKVLSAIIVVFFIVFYNAYQGTRSIRQEMISAYKMIGAKRWFVVRYIRAYVALGWSVAQFPTAVAFSLIAVITTEILVSNSGLGYLLTSALDLLDSARVFSVMIIAAIVGGILSGGARFLVTKVFPWISVVSGGGR